jgi:hypothetical protein
MILNDMYQKLSVWSKLQKQWESMERGLHSTKARPAASMGKDSCPMEVELRALRAKVDAAFNDTAKALYNHAKVERDGSTTPRSERRTDVNRTAPERNSRGEHFR